VGVDGSPYAEEAKEEEGREGLLGTELATVVLELLVDEEAGLLSV
jgi:hypothetical protein